MIHSRSHLLLGTPEAAFLLGHLPTREERSAQHGYLHLTEELVAGRGSHEDVGDGEIIVDRGHHEGVACPKNTRDEDGNLLVGRNKLSWLLEVANVREGDRPLEGRGPEED